MNTKSLVAAVAGVLMVGATTVGAGLAMANDEPVRVESETVSVVEAAPSTYVDEEYDDHEEDETYEAEDAYGEAHDDETDDEYGEEYDEDEYEHEDDEYEDLDEAEGEDDDD